MLITVLDVMEKWFISAAKYSKHEK